MRTWLPDQVYADEAQAESVLRYLIDKYEAGPPTEAPLVLGVCLPDSGELVGHVGLSPLNGLVEIGYAIADAHQGKGLATAAVRAMLAWANLATVEGIAASENAGSCRVLEAAGFSLVDEAMRPMHGVTRLVRTYRWIQGSIT